MIKWAGDVARTSKIVATVAKYRLDRNVAQFIGNPWWLRFSPFSLLPSPREDDAVRFRQALEDLGPVFIKFGQILSTRRDLLPLEYADELARLQDRVPPFDSAVATSIIEAELEKPIDEAFHRFEQEPMASASLAQVHAAELTDGHHIVVKVIRPDIEPTIEKDVRLMRTMATWLMRVSHDARRLRLADVVDDYDSTITSELNLLIEAANTETLRANFKDSPLLSAPRVHWDLCAESVLVADRVYGVPISNIDELKARGTDMKKLAERGVETFFTQVFVDNFFHADMHPGNIFVDLTDPAEPSYIAIDCAIIGQLTLEDQSYLARNILAFFNQDYRAIAELHVQSGWVPPSTNVREFEAVIRQLCTPLFRRPLSEISFGHFLLSLFNTARRFDMEVQPQLVLLQKTLLNIEGLGRQLYPDLDLWSTAKPFMERWMSERYGPTGLVRNVREHGSDLLEALPALPEILASLPRRLSSLEKLATRELAAIDQAIVEKETRDQRLKLARFVVVAIGLGAIGAMLAGAAPLIPAAGVVLVCALLIPLMR